MIYKILMEREDYLERYDLLKELAESKGRRSKDEQKGKEIGELSCGTGPERSTFGVILFNSQKHHDLVL